MKVIHLNTFKVKKALNQIETTRHLLNRELSADSINERRVDELTNLLVELNASFVDTVRDVVNRSEKQCKTLSN